MPFTTINGVIMRRVKSSGHIFLDAFDTAIESMEAIGPKHRQVVRVVRRAGQQGQSVSVTEIAAQLCDSPYHAGGMVNQLAKLGLLTRLPDDTVELGHAGVHCPLVLGEVS